MATAIPRAASRTAAQAGPPLLEISDLSVRIPTARGTVHALSEVSLRLDRGETLGLVGESGSGKSMLVRALMGITPVRSEVTGDVRLDGQLLGDLSPEELRRIWGLRIGMVFQNAMTSLNPVVRVGRQIGEAARKHLELSDREVRERVIGLLRQVGIPEPEKRARHYPHQFSGGMRQRVTIAIALACEPDLLIADEATTALDVTIQKQILDLLKRIQRERNMAMILVSHDLGVVAGRTDRVAVMYGGMILETATTPALFRGPRNRYSKALLEAIPRLGAPSHTRMTAIPGAPPDMARPPAGCPFAPRCAHAVEVCETEKPLLTAQPGAPGHLFACHAPIDDVPVRTARGAAQAQDGGGAAHASAEQEAAQSVATARAAAAEQGAADQAATQQAAAEPTGTHGSREAR